MKYTNIEGNGATNLAIQNVTNSGEVSIYAPASLGGAVVAIGWIDDNGDFIPYLDGDLLANESKRFRTGTGVQVSAEVTGFVSAFKIGYAS